jgi:ankyrin repeat protein
VAVDETRPFLNGGVPELAPASEIKNSTNEGFVDQVSDDNLTTEITTLSDPIVRADAAENPISTEQDGLIDEEDDLYGDDTAEPDRESSDFGGEEQDADTENGRLVRYELIYWPHHLQEAEMLWTRDERSKSALWEELWALALKFLCDSPRLFRTWQKRHLSESLGDDFAELTLSPLQAAATCGLTGLCEELIKRGESASALTADGRSALWFAAERSLDLLKLLLGQGANPNSLGDYFTPFHRLIWRNPAIETIQLMIDNHADCHLAGANQLTAIHFYGLSGRDVETFRLLLAHGGGINATDEWGETGLHKLMWQEPLPIPLLLEFIKNGADVNLTDKDGQQPLYEVSSQGSVDGCRTLLDHGADIEHADMTGITALSIAASHGHLDCIKLLVERSASLNVKDKHLRTPFFHACANGHVETAKYLMSAISDQGLHEVLYQAMDDGRTPFSKACGRYVLKITSQSDDISS